MKSAAALSPPKRARQQVIAWKPDVSPPKVHPQSPKPRKAGVSSTTLKSAAELARRANAGDVRACLKLGEAYERGDAVEKSVSVATSFYRKALRTNDPKTRASANFKLGRLVVSESENDPTRLAHALSLFEEAAEEKHSGAIAYIGKMQLFGTGCIQNKEKGIRNLKKAAASGNPSAQYFLSRLYEEGEIVSKDVSLSEAYLRSAALASYEAAVLLSAVRLASSSESDEVQQVKAADSLRRLLRVTGRRREEITSNVCFNLATLIWKTKFNSGKISRRADPVLLKVQFSELVSLLRKASESECGEASFRLSLLYGKGLRQIAPMNEASSRHFLQEAARQEHTSAQVKGALVEAVEETGRDLNSEGLPTAVKTTLRAAYEKGKKDVGYILALSYVIDIRKAYNSGSSSFEAIALSDKMRALLEEAARDGSGKAAYLLGLVLIDAETSPLYGFSVVKRDPRLALEMFTLASADRTNLDAVYRAATLLMEVSHSDSALSTKASRSSTPDSFTEWEDRSLVERRAIELLLWAAHGDRSLIPVTSSSTIAYEFQDGHAGACYVLALAYLGKAGIGVIEVDPDKAFVYAEKAASAELPHAIALLGTLYKEGIGVEKNVEEARAFFYSAIDAAERRSSAIIERFQTIDSQRSLLRVWSGVLPSFAVTVGQCHVAIAQLTLFEDDNNGQGDSDAVEHLQVACSYPHMTPWKVEAMSLMGYARMMGKGVSRSLAEALRLFEQTKSLGHPAADRFIKVLYRKLQGKDENE